MFPRQQKRRTSSSIARKQSSHIEELENRCLLSSTVMTPDIIFDASSSGSNQTIQGYTPAQIKKGYGFDSITGDGSGQTIAIIDAYNDPNIAKDLATFDAQLGLSAPPSLKVVNQTGGSTLPATDTGWAGEISLDVEWAHAIAPGANILLVEAKSATIDDLMAAVNFARHQAGVSVVSMSWGGSEFFSWGFGGESSSQTNFDSTFTTPAGHQGVVFVASAGDSGTYSGVQWPASSPNVLAVGGTTLVLDSAGNYVSEQSWSGTNGGYSQVESRPSYQDGVQTSVARSVPDVAYNADPSTGFAIYDSLAYQGVSGWQEVGGTSAGAPQWAALVALIDQARVAAGLGTLDGVTELLPDLYKLYTDSSTSTTSTDSYTLTFNDVVDRVYHNPWQWWWGGWSDPISQATAGYDTMTGLGTPKAAALVSKLSVSSSTSINSGGNTSDSGGSNSTTTAPSSLPDSPILPTFGHLLPISAVGEADGSAKIDLTNTSASTFNGPLVISLYASTTGTISSTDAPFATLAIEKLKIRPGGTKVEKVKFTYPSVSAAGDYTIIAKADATGTNTNPMQTTASAKITLTPGNADLATAFNSSTPIVVKPGHGDSTVVTISNSGNAVANGTINLSLFASTDGILDASDTLLSTPITRAIHLKPGKSITLRLHFLAPAVPAAGTYKVIASMKPSTSIPDSNSANDIATLDTAQ